MGKGIHTGWDSFSNFLQFDLREESKVRFWTIFGVVTAPLKDLFHLAVNKEALVSSYLAGPSEGEASNGVISSSSTVDTFLGVLVL